MTETWIPEHLRESLERYVTYGIPTGGFLQAVLENNLIDAVGRADAQSTAALPEICRYVYNELPTSCWGSPTKVREWIRTRQTENKAGG